MILRIRVLSTLLILVWAADSSAQVHLVIGRDGKKMIYNTPTAGSGGSDLVWLAKQRDRVTKYEQLIQKYSDEHDVDPVFVKAVIQVESNFNAACVSNKGARGLMQLMPETAKRFNVDRVHDPDQNIRGGVTYLAKLMKMFPSDLSRTLAAYNAGENRVLRYGGIPPYRETMTYVRRALTVYYGRPYGGVEVARSSSPTMRGGFRKPLAGPPIASSGLTKQLARISHRPSP
ncbi:MAG TPA: lytic transglycosylase domain-containing protein [Thermoanaerobaculia bacterium]|nr:lytic transglycosylase domain-containing protein [Thermoanaerobaculia bacterium]